MVVSYAVRVDKDGFRRDLISWAILSKSVSLLLKRLDIYVFQSIDWWRCFRSSSRSVVRISSLVVMGYYFELKIALRHRI